MSSSAIGHHAPDAAAPSSSPDQPSVSGSSSSVISPAPSVISQSDSPLSPRDGWQVFTDKDSGKEFYHHPVTGRTTWTHPPSLQEDVEQPGSAHSPVQGWSVCVDESSGRLFYYNHASGLTSWLAPPPSDITTTPTNQEPRQEPQVKPVAGCVPRAPPVDSTGTAAGWNQSTDGEGKTMYTSVHTHQQWIKGVDERGQNYYYLRDGSKSLWKLPAAPGPQVPQRIVGNGVDREERSKVRNWRHSMAPGEYNRFVPRHRRNLSDSSSPEKGHLLEKAGILNKTKTADNGKRVRKNWGQSWTVLHGGILTFHKDPKTTPSGTSSRSIQIPEYTVDLRGSTVCWAFKDKSSKKNVLELKTRQGCEYLVQYDTESIINDWHKVLLESIKQLDQEHVSEEEEDEDDEDGVSSDKEDTDRKRSSTRSTSDSDHGRVRSKLKRLLQRRPTLQSVKEKGYIRDNVFGCHLDTLCHRENNTVPKFVMKCIKTIEKRGLDVDGIYRVSGNLAVIQRLRHKADHEDDLNLDDGQWDEVHVITGALKLFLRELPEPLFPFSAFHKFITAIQLPEYQQRVSYMKDLVRTLPLPNYKTMEVLFTHLTKVIAHGDANRMSVQSCAIVFGPTLLRPQTETANPTVHMVFQNQIVELLLNEFLTVFCHSN